jgi:hypothetical protein
MKNFKVELLFVALGLLISLIFVFNPMPFWMAAFVFVAQPMFLFAIVSSLIRIYKDLKQKGVI